jgi:hypothetical protein
VTQSMRMSVREFRSWSEREWSWRMVKGVFMRVRERKLESPHVDSYEGFDF